MWVREAKNEVFEIVRQEQFNERILAMDITNDSGYILTVHDRFMQLQFMNPVQKKGGINPSPIWTKELSESVNAVTFGVQIGI